MTTGCAGAIGCATAARLLGGKLAGSATVMTSWLLMEQPGPWAEDIVENTFARLIGARRLASLTDAGMRPLLIRKPGRQSRAQGPLTVFIGAGWPGNHWLERVNLPDIQALEELDLEAVAQGRRGHGIPVDGPLFLVCTHGAKDMCCAVLGRPVAKELATSYPDRTWEVSHLGGDRWAGNLLVVPDGFMHGQLKPADATLVAKSAIAGQVYPNHLRGRTSTASGWEQCAEIAVREYTGLTGVDDVTVVSMERGANPWSHTMIVSAGGQRYEVDVHHQANVASDRTRCNEQFTLNDYSVVDIRATHNAWLKETSPA